MFACNGILFNHESPIRGETFVTRKITMAAAAISQGMQDCLYLGNLDSKRDWGYAKEYVEAMWLMLQQDKPEDFVIATGVTTKVRDFVTMSFKYAGIDLEWKGETGTVTEYGVDKKSGKTIIKVDPEYFRPTEVDLLIGDPTKAKTKLGWSPKTTVDELAKIMVESDLAAIKKNAR